MHQHSRPWYRARNITLGVLLTVAALAAWAIYRSVTAVPGSPVDYAAKLEALSLSRQPAEGENAVPIFERILGIVTKAQETVAARAGPAPADLPNGNGWPIDYSALLDPGVHPAVAHNALGAIDLASRDGLLTELDALVRAPRVQWPRATSPLFSTLFTELGEARNLARMGAARMHVAAGRGDWDEFARAFEHTLGVSRAVDARGFIISKLVSVAIDALALSTVRPAIASRALDEATMRRMLGAMDASARIPYTDAIEAERLGMLDSIQQVFTDNGRGDGRLILTRLNEMTGDPSLGGARSWRIINVAGMVMPGKRATTEKVEELYAGLKAFVEAAPAARASLGFQPDQWTDALPRKYLALKQLAPALSRTAWSFDQHRSLWNGTRLMLAIEIYQRRHGHYPDDLARLVPDILKEIPVDPFAPGGYRYARLEPGLDPDGSGYTLYSVGVDGKDDFGARGKAQDSAYNARDPSGDYRFNDPK
jgi:hypothetical protein